MSTKVNIQPASLRSTGEIMNDDSFRAQAIGDSPMTIKATYLMIKTGSDPIYKNSLSVYY